MGLKTFLFRTGVIQVHVEHGNDVIINKLTLSRTSDPLRDEEKNGNINKMIGVIIYQYDGKNEWTVNGKKYQSGHIIMVNQEFGEDRYFGIHVERDEFSKLYTHEYNKRLTQQERDKFIGVMFQYYRGTLVFFKNCIGKYYKEKELSKDIFDSFDELSTLELSTIGHLFEYIIEQQEENIKQPNRSLLVKDMIKTKYQNAETFSIRILKPLKAAALITILYDLYSDDPLDEVRKPIQYWNSTNCTSTIFDESGQESIYFKNAKLQPCAKDPFGTFSCYRHLRRLFVFGDKIFLDIVMKKWTHFHRGTIMKNMRMLDLYMLARKHKFTIDENKTKSSGYKEVDYLLYFIPQKDVIQDDDEDEPIIIGPDETDEKTEDVIKKQETIFGFSGGGNYLKRRNNVSIENGEIVIKSIPIGKEKFNVKEFEMSIFSDPCIDYKHDMVGMVFYLYNNESYVKSLGGIKCHSGLVYLKKRESIDEIKVIRNTWHDKLFKSLFNKELSGRFFGVAFEIKNERFIFDSSVFEFKLCKYYGNEWCDFGASMRLSLIEQRCITEVIKNWSKNTMKTSVASMLKSKYRNRNFKVEELDHVSEINDVFEPLLMFSGPFLKAYEVQSLHEHHDDKLTIYKRFGLYDHWYAHKKNASLLFAQPSPKPNGLRALYIHGTARPKASGKKLRQAIVKKFQIMNHMKLEYVCDIAVTHGWTVFQWLKTQSSYCKQRKLAGAEMALFLKYTGDAPQITKALVILLGISDYSQSQSMNNLPGVEIDMRKQEKLWREKYGYDIFPSDKFKDSGGFINKRRWDRDDINSFFEMAVNTFLQNKFKEKYDGIIVCFSGHGSKKNTIQTSTGSYMDIHELQNKYFCENSIIANLPRVFLLDCCRAGDYDAEKDDAFADDENEFLKGVKCKCGETLVSLKCRLLTKYWDDGGVRCDQIKCKGKSRAMNAADTVFMCTNKKNHKEKGGYFEICKPCAEHKKLLEIKYDMQNKKNKSDKNVIKQNCICDGQLIERKMKQIKVINWKRNKVVIEEEKEDETYSSEDSFNKIEKRTHVTCNRCHKKEFNEEAIMYDCPQKGKEECHPGGYNLCSVCYSNKENKPKNLLTTIYGNSPLKSVIEKGSKGGIFTHSVCQALSNNNGTIELWELCANMNAPLTDSSDNKQIVFKEGTAATMDKLLIYPHETGRTDYKSAGIVPIVRADTEEKFEIKRNQHVEQNIKQFLNDLQSKNKNEITNKDKKIWLNKFTEPQIYNEFSNDEQLTLSKQIENWIVKYHMEQHFNKKPKNKSFNHSKKCNDCKLYFILRKNAILYEPSYIHLVICLKQLFSNDDVFVEKYAITYAFDKKFQKFCGDLEDDLTIKLKKYIVQNHEHFKKGLPQRDFNCGKCDIVSAIKDNRPDRISKSVTISVTNESKIDRPPTNPNYEPPDPTNETPKLSIVEILWIISIIILFVFNIIVAVIMVFDMSNTMEDAVPYLINNIFIPLHIMIQLLLILGRMEWLAFVKQNKCIKRCILILLFGIFFIFIINILVYFSKYKIDSIQTGKYYKYYRNAWFSINGITFLIIFVNSCVSFCKVRKSNISKNGCKLFTRLSLLTMFINVLMFLQTSVWIYLRYIRLPKLEHPKILNNNTFIIIIFGSDMFCVLFGMLLVYYLRKQRLNYQERETNVSRINLNLSAVPAESNEMMHSFMVNATPI